MPFTDKNRWELLKLLKEGKSQRIIAETLGIAPSVVNYHVKKLLKQDLIREVKTTKYFGPQTKLYSLTNEGKTILSPTNSTISGSKKPEKPENEGKTHTPSTNSTFSVGGQENPSRPRWLMHHAQYKYLIKKDAPIQMSVEVHLKNWVKKIDEWKYCKAVKSGKSIIFHIKNLYGNTPHGLLLRSREIADKMASIYEDNWGMELGRPQMLGTPHWKDLWDDKTWAEYSKYISLETSSGFIDKTPPEGGLEFKSPESAVNHVNVGDNVARLIGRVSNLEGKADKQIDLLEDIKNAFDKFFESQQYQSLPEKDEKKDVA